MNFWSSGLVNPCLLALLAGPAYRPCLLGRWRPSTVHSTSPEPGHRRFRWLSV